MKGLSSAAALALLSHNRSVCGAAQMQQMTHLLALRERCLNSFQCVRLGNLENTDIFLQSSFSKVGAGVHGKGHGAVAALPRLSPAGAGSAASAAGSPQWPSLS